MNFLQLFYIYVSMISLLTAAHWLHSELPGLRCLAKGVDMEARHLREAQMLV